MQLQRHDPKSLPRPQTQGCTIAYSKKPRKTGLLSRTFFKKEINQVSDLSLKRYLKQLRSDLGPCIIADIGMSKQENPISGLIQI